MSSSPHSSVRFGCSVISAASPSRCFAESRLGQTGCCGIRVFEVPIWILAFTSARLSFVSSRFSAGPM